MRSPFARLVLVAAVAAATAQTNPPASGDTSQDARSVAAVGVPSNATASGPFRSADAVRIYVYPDTGSFLNGTYAIDNKGCIMLPFDGATPISGMSEKQLTDYLINRYVKYLLYPQVHVRRLVRLAFLGGFQRPGMYYVDPTHSLWEAVNLAGVPQREDGLRLLRWQRGDRVIGKDLVGPLEQGLSLDTMGIRSGDRICVTARPKRQANEIFQTNVFPWIGLSVSLLTTGITAYQFKLLIDSRQ
jgi:protein involved in polysaccharide export with SLBB domain